MSAQLKDPFAEVRGRDHILTNGTTITVELKREPDTLTDYRLSLRRNSNNESVWTLNELAEIQAALSKMMAEYRVAAQLREQQLLEERQQESKAAA